MAEELERITAAASDMGFDDPQHMLEVLEGQGLTVVMKTNDLESEVAHLKEALAAAERKRAEHWRNHRSASERAKAAEARVRELEEENSRLTRERMHADGERTKLDEALYIANEARDEARKERDEARTQRDEAAVSRHDFQKEVARLKEELESEQHAARRSLASQRAAEARVQELTRALESELEGKQALLDERTELIRERNEARGRAELASKAGYDVWMRTAKDLGTKLDSAEPRLAAANALLEQCADGEVDGFAIRAHLAAQENKS